MKMSNPKTEQYHDYWDEGQHNPPYYRWYKKGFWKREGRKKFIKNFLRESERD
jgi:hypothetical protein